MMNKLILILSIGASVSATVFVGAILYLIRIPPQMRDEVFLYLSMLFGFMILATVTALTLETIMNRRQRISSTSPQ